MFTLAPLSTDALAQALSLILALSLAMRDFAILAGGDDTPGEAGLAAGH